MKKVYLYLFAAVAMFAAVSCNEEIGNEQNNITEGAVVVFEASVDGADTKMTLEGTLSNWESGDKITIYNNDNAGFHFTTQETGTTARFVYNGTDFSGDKFIAVYPAGSHTVSVNAKTVQAYIPTNQAAVAGTYAKYGAQNENDAALAVAYTENNNLFFRNASALLKFTINCDDVKNVEFYGNNGEAITGNVLVSLNEDATVKAVDGLDTEFDGKKQKMTWVNCYPLDGGTNNWRFKKGTYYAVIAPQNFTKGVAMNLILEDDHKVEPFKKITTSKEVKPNTILNLGTIEHKTIYLRPGVWADANAWFFAHFFDGEYAKDIKMTDSDGDGILEAAVPFGVKKVIFVRKNPSDTNVNWDNKWNESAELALPTTTSECYSVNDWSSMKWETLADARKSMLYLKPNSNWTSSNARFAAYFFSNNGNTWRTMTDWNKDGIYEVSRPTSNNANMIFCRMNPNFTVNSWDADGNDYQWNKTGDLTTPALGGNNLFTVPNNAWDGSTTGWSKKTF